LHDVALQINDPQPGEFNLASIFVNGSFTSDDPEFQTRTINFEKEISAATGSFTLGSMVLLDLPEVTLHKDFTYTFTDTLITLADVETVPEPSTWLLLVTGLTSLVGYGWRRRKKDQRTSVRQRLLPFDRLRTCFSLHAAVRCAELFPRGR
jgi:PEP-CTERM motif-containing protein